MINRLNLIYEGSRRMQVYSIKTYHLHFSSYINNYRIVCSLTAIMIDVIFFSILNFMMAQQQTYLAKVNQ